VIFAHVIGIPIEESALALAPAGAAIVPAGSSGGFGIAADQDHVAFGEPASVH